MNYSEALQTLNSPRSKDSKKVANNTYLIRNDNGIALKLHETDIINYLPGGSIVLDSGTWRTVTTKERINEFQNLCRLYQEHSVWYVSTAKDRKIFADGITISKNGRITKGLPLKAVKKTIDLKKKINKYINGYISAFFAGNVSTPSSGDCWYCSMNTDNGQSLGDCTKDTSHLIEHFKECYYVPSLLVNAMKHTPVCRFAENALYHAWNVQDFIDMSDFTKEVAVRDFKRSLRAYLYSQFSIAK